ncbi:MAG: HEAT repeat domain-containing protein [Planctomycetota bacterium]|nr:HEAT repeat domain-containing protein [Planctomycetota bacterium]
MPRILLFSVVLLLCSCKPSPNDTKPKGDPTYKDKSVKQWIAQLNDPTKDTRETAVYALGQIGTEASPPLLELIVPQLHTAIDDKRSDVRCEAIKALGLIGKRAPSALSEETIKKIASGIYDRRDDVREEAAKSLGKIGAKAAPHCDALQRGLHDSDDDVREESAESLGELAKFADEKQLKVATTALIQALVDKDKSVVRNAIEALENLGAKAVPALISAVEGQTPPIQTRAIDILGEIGKIATAAIPTLKVALKNPATAPAAKEALTRIEGS